MSYFRDTASEVIDWIWTIDQKRNATQFEIAKMFAGRLSKL